MNLRFEPAHAYCTTFWCILNEHDSLFTYLNTESFLGYFDCGATLYDPSLLQKAVEVAPDSLRAVCGQDIACLIDGSVGDLKDASAYLEDRAKLESIKKEVGLSVHKDSPETPQKEVQRTGTGNWENGVNGGSQESVRQGTITEKNVFRKRKGGLSVGTQWNAMNGNKRKRDMKWKRIQNMMFSGRNWREKQWKHKMKNVGPAGMRGIPQHNGSPLRASLVFATRTQSRQRRDPQRPLRGRFEGAG